MLDNLREYVTDLVNSGSLLETETEYTALSDKLDETAMEIRRLIKKSVIIDKNLGSCVFNAYYDDVADFVSKATDLSLFCDGYSKKFQDYADLARTEAEDTATYGTHEDQVRGDYYGSR